MTYSTFGGQVYNLAGSIGSTATTITLSSFLEPVTQTPYTMALLNTDIVYATIAPRTSSSEFISFTGITQNANGTATLTGVVRGLAKKYPFTTDSSYKLPHAGQSQFIISDAPQVFEKYVSIENDQTIDGSKTFSDNPVVPTPLGNFDAATKKYVDDTVNGGPVSNNAVVVAATAGETVASGNLLYFSEVDNEWLKCDADVATSIQSTQLGIAQGAGVNGGAITGGVLIFGVDGTGSGMVQGDLLYASNTAGGITNAPGTIPRVIGIATSTTSRYFNPFFQAELQRYVADTGSLNALAATLPGNFSAYYNGMVVSVKVANTNTLTSTLAVNGGSAVTITKGTGVALTPGDLLINTIASFMYNSTGPTFQLISPPANIYPLVQVFSGNGTWTKPTGAKFVIVEVVGGGGGGGGGQTGTSAADKAGGGGGGGGSFTRRTLNAANLTSTVAVTVGAAGAGGASGGSGAGVGANGTPGGSSNFGSYLFAYGGGYGGRGNSTTALDHSGGGGGGSAGNGTGNVGGAPTPAANAGGVSGQGAYGGAGAAGAVAGLNGEYGGGGGGASPQNGAADGAGGGGSVYGAAAGGAGGGFTNTTGVASAGGAGGGIGVYSGGTGGAGGTPANAASNGANGTSQVGYGTGTGGGGGAGSFTSNSGNGGVGGTPGGGGGGGGGGITTGGFGFTGNGGAGGAGEVRVYTWA